EPAREERRGGGREPEAPQRPERGGDEQREAGEAELEERSDVRVLRQPRVEEVVAVDEGALLGAEPVARHRPPLPRVEGARPRLRAPARAEEAAPDRRVRAVLGADLLAERQDSLRVPLEGGTEGRGRSAVHGPRGRATACRRTGSRRRARTRARRGRPARAPSTPGARRGGRRPRSPVARRRWSPGRPR